MSRTVIHQSDTEPVVSDRTYSESSSQLSQGAIFGIVLAVLVILVAVLAVLGLFSGNDSNTNIVPGTGDTNTTAPTTAPENTSAPEPQAS